MSSSTTRVIGPGDRALTFRQARELYGVPEHRLRQYRTKRTIDFFKLGRAVFVSEQSLVRFLESRREPADVRQQEAKIE
jgi:Helix-turn-helix domain